MEKSKSGFHFCSQSKTSTHFQESELWQSFYSLQGEAETYPETLLGADIRKQRPEIQPQISSFEFQMPNVNPKRWEPQRKPNMKREKKKLC